MSILVTDPTDGFTKLFIKGADSEIKARLSEDNDEEYIEKAELFLEQASGMGFRTLLMGMRIVDDKELEQFQEAVAETNSMT